MTGQRLGQWELGAELPPPPGGGAAYHARSTTDPGRAAAVIILPAAPSATLAKFPAEMLGLKRLDHPNIVAYFDAGVADGRPWYAVEWVDGIDAANLLKTRPKAPGQPGLAWADDVLRIAVQVARALKHGHHRSLLHRALTPTHLLVTPAGIVKVAGFGLTKVRPVPVADLPPDPWGVAGFLAPEQFTGRPFTRKSDLYALGGVLYALTTGRPPFPAASIAEFLHKHCYTLPDRPAAFVPDVPPDLDELICTLLAKDPNRRPGSAAAVIEALDQIRGRVERKGRKIAWPADPGDQSGPLPALPEAVEAAAHVRRPLLSRPLVVGPLFALVVAAGAGLALRPRPSADELFAQARPLIDSTDPADWDKALTDYLDPLADRHPGEYAAEIAAVKQRAADRRELRRALADGAKVRPGSAAERLYLRGLRLAQAGDWPAARRVWAAVGTVFGPVPAEERWVKLAAAAIAATDTNPGSTIDPATLAAALAAHAGTPGEAAMKAILRDLYRDDPAALAIINGPPR